MVRLTSEIFVESSAIAGSSLSVASMSPGGSFYHALSLAQEIRRAPTGTERLFPLLLRGSASYNRTRHDLQRLPACLGNTVCSRQDGAIVQQ